MRVSKLAVVVYIMIVAAVGLWAFNFGRISPAVEAQGVTLGLEYTEQECDDIIWTGDRLQCEIVMVEEDDNIRIFRAPGARDD